MISIMSRDLQIHKASFIDPECISLPYVYINPQFGYSTDKILRRIYESPDVFLKPSAFPNDIKEYYWIQAGEAGVKEWYALGVLNEDIYFLYKAYTNNTFSKDGHMDLWISYRFSDIIQYAMDTAVYNTYIKDTQD